MRAFTQHAGAARQRVAGAEQERQCHMESQMVQNSPGFHRRVNANHLAFHSAAIVSAPSLFLLRCLRSIKVTGQFVNGM